MDYTYLLKYLWWNKQTFIDILWETPEDYFSNNKNIEKYVAIGIKKTLLLK